MLSMEPEPNLFLDVCKERYVRVCRVSALLKPDRHHQSIRLTSRLTWNGRLSSSRGRLGAGYLLIVTSIGSDNETPRVEGIA
jgi:hypothetical protein